MRYIWKRCFAALLSVALVFALLPATARAGETGGTTGQTAVEQVQALIDALPDAESITADNRADVEAQLTAVDEAKQDLTDDELDNLDITRYMAAVEAILALDGMSGADKPATIATEYNVAESPVLIKGDGEYTITGISNNAHTITVESGKVKITLNNVTVTNSDFCAFDIQSGDVTLILNGNSTFESGSHYAGIHVAKDASLTITGDGTLYAVSKAVNANSPHDGTIGAGIGGNGEIGAESTDSGDNAGAITINSGTIYARSEGDGAGIGGGWTSGTSREHGRFGSITITGGTVYAESERNGAGIGSGCWASEMGTINITGGEIHAKTKADAGGSSASHDIGAGHGVQTGGEIKITGGVVYTENRGIFAYSGTVKKNNTIIFSRDGKGEVYGNVTLDRNLTIPENQNLYIPEGSSLTVSEGRTLTVGSGATLKNDGVLDNQGTVSGDGSVIGSGEFKGNLIDYYVSVTVPAFESEHVEYTQPEAQAITIQNEGKETVTISSVTVNNNDFTVEPADSTPVKIQSGGTDVSYKISPNANLPGGIHTATVTVTYDGGRKAVAKVSFMVHHFAVGEGTPENPYQIRNLEELKAFRDFINNRQNGGGQGMYFELMADIDLGGSAAPWTPIGNDDYPFNGSFDGGNHTISGLYIHTNGQYQGLFGYIGEDGIVKNLTVEGDITSKTYAGGIVAQCLGSLENCHNLVNVSGTNIAGGIAGAVSGSASVQDCTNSGDISGTSYIGGIVGQIANGSTVTISRCQNSGEISGTGANIAGVVGGVENSNSNIELCSNSEGTIHGGTNTGGIAGYNKGTITECYNTGDVSGSGSIGGIAGTNIGTVMDCYNTGEISGVLPAGGVVGSGTAEKCYNAGKVTGTGDATAVAEAVGSVVGTGSCTDCYYLEGTYEKGTGRYGDTGATKKSAAEFHFLSSSLGDGWADSTAGHPVLTSNPEAEIIDADTPYEIPDLDTLKAFRDYINSSADGGKGKTFKLMDDITLDSTKDTPWKPIGNRDHYFQGTFDGNGRTISNLYVTSKSAGFDSGLFGYIGESGTVKGLSVSGFVSGNSSVGGIAGNNDGNINNCTFSGTVTCEIESKLSMDVGGITSFNNGTISNCTNSGKVTNNSAYVGGIVGDNRGSVTNCSNSGEITGTGADTHAGGITGSNGSKGALTGCINTGNINAANYPAGIASNNSYGTISNCYNTGNISGSGNSPGGIVGNDYYGTIKNCYNIGSIGGSNKYSGGIIGNSDKAVVANCYNAGDISGSDSGGIIGYVISSGGVTNCYYLHDTASSGFGYGKGDATEISTEEFASGEVAWLLQNGQGEQVWGQTLKDSANEYPVLTNAPEKKVCKVTFHTEGQAEYAVKYTNYNGKVELPTEPTLDGKLFDHWSTVEGAGGETFDNNTTVTGDITVYAVGRETFGGENEDILLSAVYGEGASLNLSEYVKYKSGTVTAGKFTYEITDGNNELNATIEGDNLKIPETANAGDYTLTIKATETEPQYSLMSVGTFGTNPVTLTVKVTVAKAEPTVTPPTANTLTYTGEPQDLVSAGTTTGSEMQYSLDGSSYSATIPTGIEANEYTVWYKVVGDANHNDTAPQTLTVSISRAAPTVTVQAVTGTYGEDITLTAKVTVSGVDENLINGTIQFEDGGTTLGTADVENGTATLPVSGTDRDKQHALFGTDGRSNVTAAYSGNNNIEGESGNGDATISQRDLQYTVAAEDKTFDGKSDISVTLTPSNALSGDQVSLTAVGAVESPDAGTYNTVNLTDITLSGEDARYYTVETDKTGVELTSPVSIIEEVSDAALHGKVTQGGSPVADADVTLKQGGKTVAATTTGADGSYSFENAAPGVYDVVVEKDGKTMTSMVTITDETGMEQNLALPTENVSSVLDTQKVSDSVVAVGGLDDAASENAETGSAVTVIMTVESKTESTAEHAQEIKSVAGGRELDYMAIELEKETTTGGTTKEEPLTETTQPITIVLRFDFTGKDNVVVYRYHGTAVDTLTETANGNGESIKLDAAGGTITLHVKNFSTYAIGYTLMGQTPTPPSAYPAYFSVAVPSGFEGGSVTSSLASARQGSRVTLTVTPDEGYHFGSLTVKNGYGKPVELTDNGDGTYTFTMPYGKVTVKAEFVKCGSLSFTDLDIDAWYHDCTDYIIAHGLMQGIGGGLFAPDGTVNRAQMVMVLWNMSDKPVVNYYMTYSDVSEDAWYAEAVRWATSEGIAAGYGNGKFGPDDPITREQMAAMMYRYEQKYGDGGFTGAWMYRLPFTDLEAISDWAFESVAWCNMEGVITGKDDNVFDPKGLAKRSEMAAILTRYCDENDIK